MIDRINSAILEICSEIEKQIGNKNFSEMKEEHILFELVLSILGSQCKFETAFAACEELEKANLLDAPYRRYTKQKYRTLLQNILSKPMYRKEWNGRSRKYRFYKTRSEYIVESIWNLYSMYDSIKELIKTGIDLNELRSILINNVKGFGPKEASHFLRNIGYNNNIAILDTHILKYMYYSGVIEKPIKYVTNIKLYEKLEKLLINLIRQFEYSIVCIDQAIWIVMRVYQKEYVR